MAVLPDGLEPRAFELKAVLVPRVVVPARLVQAYEQRQIVAQLQQSEVVPEVFGLLYRHYTLQPLLAPDLSLPESYFVRVFRISRERGVVHAAKACCILILRLQDIQALPVGSELGPGRIVREGVRFARRLVPMHGFVQLLPARVVVGDGVEGGLWWMGFFGEVPREFAGDQTVVVLLYKHVRIWPFAYDHGFTPPEDHD